MKKAKIFLTALTVLAVVGGAVAFKAKAPKEFAQCDLSVLNCKINVTTLPVNTTLIDNGSNTIQYDLIDTDCKFSQPLNRWTCTTLTTIE